jgi:hypothetical protein
MAGQPPSLGVRCEHRAGPAVGDLLKTLVVDRALVLPYNIHLHTKELVCLFKLLTQRSSQATSLTSN